MFSSEPVVFALIFVVFVFTFLFLTVGTFTSCSFCLSASCVQGNV